MTSRPAPNAFIRVDPEHPDRSLLAPAAEALRAGAFVVFPTETVYGVGVHPDVAGGAARLNALKGRPPDQPLSVHLASAAGARARLGRPSPLAWRLLDRFAPGPLTLVGPSAGEGPEVGLRVPSSPACTALLEAVGGALLGTSANLTGDPPPARAADVSPRLLARVAAAIDAGPCRFAAASTVVRVDHDRPEILREGAIPGGLILDECGPVTLLVCTGNTCRSPLAAAMLRSRLRERFEAPRAARGLPLPAVASAGVAAAPGAPASPHAVGVAATLGLDLRAHHATVLAPALIERAEFILTVSASAAGAVRALVPEAHPRIWILNRDGGGIPDPFGGPAGVYETCARALARALEVFLDHHAGRFAGLGGSPDRGR